MKTQSLCAIETYEPFKALSDINLNFMKEIVYSSPNLTHRKDNLYIHSRNTIRFSNESLRSLRGSEFSSYKIDLRNRVTPKDFILQVLTQIFLSKFFFRVTNLNL